VTSGLSSGCHLVLRQWPEAVLVTNADEVIEAVGPMGRLAPLPLGQSGPRDGLDELMGRVLEAIPSRRPRDAGWIAQECGQSEFVVERMLQPLLANGLIEQSPDGYRLTDLGRQPAGGAPP
jgi:DNA processing protein